MNEYWRLHLVPVSIPISQELIAKIRGEHWENWPPQHVLPSVKPLLDAIEERKKNPHANSWRPPTDDALRAHYGTPASDFAKMATSDKSPSGFAGQARKED